MYYFVPLPSCAVAKIRETFVTEHHRGFQDVDWVSNIEILAMFFFYNAYKYIHISNTRKSSVTVKFEQSK